MAQGKKSFVLYADLIHTIEKMPTDKAGELFKHILRYVNDQEPETDDLIVNLTFEPIKQQLKRDLQKFEDVKLKRSEAGKLSAELRALKKAEQELTNSTSVESDEQESTNSTVNDNVNVNDNVSVNVNDIKNINYNNTVISKNDAFLEFWNIYNKKQDKISCESKFLKLSKKDIENILMVVKDYVLSTPEVKYRKNPLTWLNKKCWNDEMSSENKPTQMSFEEIKAEQRKNMAF